FGGRRELDREAMPAETCGRFGDGGHRIVVVEHRAVAGATGRHKLEPGHALLGRLDRIKTAAGNIDAEAADLADRFGATFKELGMVVDEEACAEQATGFLIGKEGEDDIARRAPPLPGP